MFEESPTKFAPQFGGYCAFAVSKGFTANTDPNAFEFINDKLYLFADIEMKANWLEQLKENKTKSEEKAKDEAKKAVKCGYCGSMNKHDALKCSSCGAPVEK